MTSTSPSHSASAFRITFWESRARSKAKLKVVTNNYRVNGGGGTSMYKNAVVCKSSAEVRELIIDCREEQDDSGSDADNWRIVGANWQPPMVAAQTALRPRAKSR